MTPGFARPEWLDMVAHLALPARCASLLGRPRHSAQKPAFPWKIVAYLVYCIDKAVCVVSKFTIGHQYRRQRDITSAEVT
jgi:hypothetical protein